MVTQQLQFGWDRVSSSEGEAQGEERSVCQVATASEKTEPRKGVTMEEVVRRENLQKALKRVCANKGSPGADGTAVEELREYLKTHWPGVREELLQGQYKPQPVKQVMIPNLAGGDPNAWDSRRAGVDRLKRN